MVASSEPPHPGSGGGEASGGPLRRPVVITNPQGLHMRPAAAFAQLARQYQCSVTVWHGDRQVNGKSWLDLLLLAAEPGSELIVEVVGNDASAALAALAELLAAPSADDEIGGGEFGLGDLGGGPDAPPPPKG